MAETKFNIDVLASAKIKLNPSDSSWTYPKGIDFPDGTKWRKPIEGLCNPAAPADPEVYYLRSNSEHTGYENKQMFTDTPRWRDTDLVPYINAPDGFMPTFGVSTIDQVGYDPADDYASYDPNGVKMEKGVVAPLVHIYAPSLTGETYTATLEIYNPSTIPVFWDIVYSASEVSVGAKLIKSWKSNIILREIGAKSKVSVSISTDISNLVIGNDVTASGAQSYFQVVTYDAYHAIGKLGYVAQSSGYYNMTKYLGNNMGRSAAFALITCSGWVLVKNEMHTGLDVYLRHRPHSTGGYRTTAKITNPWNIGLNFLIYTNPSDQNSALPESFYIGAGETKTMMIYHILNDANPYRFGFGFDKCYKNPIVYYSLNKRIYPPYVEVTYMSSATGAGGNGSSITLYTHNVQDSDVDEVRLEGSTYYDETASVTSGYLNPGGETGDSEVTFKINSDLSNSGLLLEGTRGTYTEVIADAMELGGDHMSFRYYFKPIQYPPSVQSASQVDSYEAVISVMNENSHPVHCNVAVRGMTDWIDPATGKTVRREGSWFNLKRWIDAGSEADFNFIFNDSQGTGDIDYSVYFYNPEGWLATTEVTGQVS